MADDDTAMQSLRIREPAFINSDDLPILGDPTALQTETSFTDINQAVQKAEIDLFGNLILK